MLVRFIGGPEGIVLKEHTGEILILLLVVPCVDINAAVGRVAQIEDGVMANDRILFSTCKAEDDNAHVGGIDNGVVLNNAVVGGMGDAV